MKELSVEEKAARYDAAIERARKCLDEKRDTCFVRPDVIFPELKESEDERIRKELIEALKQLDREKCPVDTYPYLYWVAWLEKQGDTNETINRDEFAQGILRGAAIHLITWIDYNAAEGNMCLSNMECKDIEDALVSGNWDKIYAYIKKKLEKQGEQKPQGKTALEAINEEKVDNSNKVEPKDYNSIDPLFGKPIDKIEPKFHKGEWVVIKQ